MPIFLFLYLLRSNYDYVSLLWTDPIGMIMSASAVGMLFAGAFWMRSVVKIEV
jgi:tight adherence protein B